MGKALPVEERETTATEGLEAPHAKYLHGQELFLQLEENLNKEEPAL